MNIYYQFALIFSVLLLISAQYLIALTEDHPFHNAEVFELVELCADDCPLVAIHVFQDEYNLFQIEKRWKQNDMTETLIGIEGLKANKPDAPIVLTTHPDANAIFALRFLETARHHDEDYVIHYRIAAEPLVAPRIKTEVAPRPHKSR